MFQQIQAPNLPDKVLHILKDEPLRSPQVLQNVLVVLEDIVVIQEKQGGL